MLSMRSPAYFPRKPMCFPVPQVVGDCGRVKSPPPKELGEGLIARPAPSGHVDMRNAVFEIFV